MMVGRLQVIANVGKLMIILTYVAAIGKIVNKWVQKVVFGMGFKVVDQCRGVL